MQGSGRWGSSEYSSEAEELFARYLASGADMDEGFAAFAEEYPDHEDELLGLRADWDNVRGILGELGLEPRRAAVPEPAPDAPQPASAPREPAPAAVRVERSGAPAWARVALVALGATALALGALGYRSWRESRALAAEKQELLSRHERDQQAARDRQATLEREREALREETRELEAARAEAERAAAREARRAGQLADWRTLEALEAEATRLWPAVPGLVPRLEDWLERAREPVRRWSRAALPLEASSGGEALEATAAPELAALLERFEQPGAGLLARVERRLRRARGSAWDADAAAAPDGPGSQGLELPLQAGLAPLEPEPATRPLEFAFLPTWDGAGKGAPNDSQAPPIVLALIPRVSGEGVDASSNGPIEDEGGLQNAAFFLSKGPLGAEGWRRLGVAPPLAWSLLGLPAPGLAALGLRTPSAAELRRAREAGCLDGVPDAPAWAWVARSLDR
jgi:hypothetical protein